MCVGGVGWRKKRGILTLTAFCSVTFRPSTGYSGKSLSGPLLFTTTNTYFTVKYKQSVRPLVANNTAYCWPFFLCWQSYGVGRLGWGSVFFHCFFAPLFLMPELCSVVTQKECVVKDILFSRSLVVPRNYAGAWLVVPIV